MIHHPSIAKRFSIPNMTFNCVGFCDNFYSVSKSSVWNKKGNLMGQLDDQSQGMLIFDTEIDDVWSLTI